MLIKALCDYYDAQQKKNSSENSPPDCFTKQNVHYMIMLTKDGNIKEILPVRSAESDAKKKPVMGITLPKRSQKTGIDLNIIEHRPLYIFGLNYNKGEFSSKDKTNKAKKSHDCFVKGNLEFFENLESDIAVAFKNFLKSWNPDEQLKNPELLNLGKDYSSSYYCFALDGHPEIQLQNDSQVVQKYIEYSNHLVEKKEVKAVCPIEGKELKVARIHNKVQGIKGSNSTGGTLVCVKESAFESYNKSQSYNSNISETAMKKYTSALNDLLANSAHRIFADEMTIVFFAIAENDEMECECLLSALNSDEDDEMNACLASAAKKMLQGEADNFSEMNVDENVTFYIFGLTPNSSRISQKFIVKNSFGQIMRNVIQHQIDLAFSEDFKSIPLWRINKELVSPKASKENAKVPVTVESSMLEAVLKGTRYPRALLYSVLQRIKTDQNEEDKNNIKINKIRASIVKACLNREARLNGKEEEIKMSLDLNNLNSAYNCGRLFAVLEKIQVDALGNLNKTIMDSYFKSACSKPATVFASLCVLSQNHLSSIKKDNLKKYSNYQKIMGEIIDNLDNEFPKTLSLEDQGRFVIGYYHQNRELYKKGTIDTNKE